MRSTVLTRHQLDVAECGNPNCDHSDHRHLVLHSQCHPEMPTWARYDKVTGILTLTCAVCDKPVSGLKIAGDA